MLTVRTDLTDKIILITGASRGIGKSVALNCAKAGAEVIINGRTIGELEELDDEISKIGGKATIVELDQTDKAAMARLGQAVAAVGADWTGLWQMQASLAKWHPCLILILKFLKIL